MGTTKKAKPPQSIRPKLPTNGRSRELTAVYLLTHPHAVAEYFVEKRYAELADLADYVQHDVPLELAFTDPALFRTLRQAITDLHCRGFGQMNTRLLRELARKKAESSLPETFDVKDLVARITPENHHGETDWGIPQGAEVG